jgi:nucleotide-binding universal stress UspA family protein
VAAARDADLIVMATHGRSGVGAVWAGSVAQRIIAQSTRPVLLVRIAPTG